MKTNREDVVMTQPLSPVITMSLYIIKTLSLLVSSLHCSLFIFSFLLLLLHQLHTNDLHPCGLPSNDSLSFFSSILLNFFSVLRKKSSVF